MTTLTTRPRHRLTPLAATLPLLAALAACGGASTDDSGTNASPELAQSAGVNAAVIPTDTNDALATALTTAQAVVAAADASQTYSCPGGGTATYTATGASATLLANHQFDAGEQYGVTYTSCKSATGAATVNGTLSLTVNSASGSDFAVSTATSNVTVALPLRTVTLNGSSSLTHTVATSGNTTTTTNHWVTPSFTAVSASGSRSSIFSYTNVDLTRSIVVANGVLSGSSHNGSATLSATLPNTSFTMTVATQGTVSCDASGVPTSGTWAITLPHNALTLSIAGGTATLSVDYGANGSIDKVYTFAVSTVVASAG